MKQRLLLSLIVAIACLPINIAFAGTTSFVIKNKLNGTLKMVNATEDTISAPIKIKSDKEGKVMVANYWTKSSSTHLLYKYNFMQNETHYKGICELYVKFYPPFATHRVQYADCTGQAKLKTPGLFLHNGFTVTL